MQNLSKRFAGHPHPDASWPPHGESPGRPIEGKGTDCITPVPDTHRLPDPTPCVGRRKRADRAQDAELRRGVAKPASESRKPTGHGRFREQSACQHEAREKTLKPARQNGFGVSGSARCEPPNASGPRRELTLSGSPPKIYGCRSGPSPW